MVTTRTTEATDHDHRIWRKQRKSLIVALAEAKGEPIVPEIADLQDWTKKMAHLGAQIDGALELAWRRGEHKGYVTGYKDGRARRRNKWKQK